MAKVIQAAADLGIAIDQEALVGALAKRYGRGLRVSINGAAICLAAENAGNRRLSAQVAKWAIRALGPDTTLRESYPFYVALALEHGFRPWTFSWYQRKAFGYNPRIRTRKQAKKAGEE